jgi:hypothetical protein
MKFKNFLELYNFNIITDETGMQIEADPINIKLQDKDGIGCVGEFVFGVKYTNNEWYENSINTLDNKILNKKVSAINLNRDLDMVEVWLC